MIAIIDYGAGNIGSVCNALDSLNAEYIVTSNADEILSADRVIFPGQGRAGSALKVLSELGLDLVIPKITAPFLGICVGMQLLLDYSEEDDTQCLGIISGRVKKFPRSENFPVPQIGWNRVTCDNSVDLISDQSFFYFANSYYVDAPANSFASISYGLDADVAIRKDNFLGVQFHPEKSGKAGMQFLQNFLNWQPEKNNFTVYPAIDLIGGRCVRLKQGDYNQKTEYDLDPVSVALDYVKSGAQFLHIIDLDGAKIGSPQNFSTLKKILEVVDIPIQVGGGIRSLDDAQKLLDLGVSRIILGTSVFKNPDLLSQLLNKYGSDRIIVSLDIVDGKIAINGWKDILDISLESVLEKISGISTVIVTDIKKDGMQAGPNFELAQFLSDSGFEIILAGGVSEPRDVLRLKSIGIDGAIIGKALYESEYTLKDFLRPFSSQMTQLPKRIIPCLDIQNERVVKGVNFVNVIDVGSPLESALAYEKFGADELVFLDITATIENRSALHDLIRLLAANLRIPFTVGGGVKNISDISDLLLSGADKVSIGSATIRTPELINEASKKFGSQCIVISVDAKKNNDSWNIFIDGGRTDTGKNVVDFVREIEERGAGELLVNSIDRDGMKNGFDLDLLNCVSENCNLPVIASSGAGSLEDFSEVFLETPVSAALAASVFHSGQFTVSDVKENLLTSNISIRENY